MANPPVLTAVQSATSVDHQRVVGRPRGRRARGAAPASAKVGKSQFFVAIDTLLLERIVEIRAGDTWRNVRATLESIKVVEY